MLSIENLPPDPPCPCQISLLKSSSSSSSCSDDQKGPSDKLVKKLDLSDSGLDDYNPLPKFSIRDYVSSIRRKDIKTNWPFRQKSLQLCLKHGVTDILPPFQSVGKDSIITSVGEHVEADDIPLFAIAVDYTKIGSSGSEREKVLQSTTTSQSCSEIDSVPTSIRNSCLEAEGVTLREPLVGKPEGKSESTPSSNRSGSAMQPPSKKCRLAAKLSNSTNPTLEEGTTVNNFMVSEAMTSKVCPVCKTFSSSSNTTLNAHIDQCLSGESTIKWTTKSKVIKHNIKPRKTRLMVDIYKRAAHFTLEELDRRNGTNWASNLNLPVQEIVVSADDKMERPPLPVNLECTGEGAVYIDEKGKKLRILSKSHVEQLSPLKQVNDPVSKKLVEGDKGSRFILTKRRKKKKNHVQKYNKLLKSASPNKQFRLPKPYHTTGINCGQERNLCAKEDVDKDDHPGKFLKSRDQVLYNGWGTIKQWTCSKRTGLTRKISAKDCHPLSGGDVVNGLRNDTDQLHLSDSLIKGSSLLKATNSSAKLVSFPGSSKRMGDTPYEPHADDIEERSLQKEADFSLSRSRFPRDKKRPLVSQKCKTNLKVDGLSVHANDGFLTEITLNCASPLTNRRAETNTGLLKNDDKSFVNSKTTTFHQSFSSKARKFASLRKNIFSVSQASIPGGKCNLKRANAARKKSRLHCTLESEEAAVWQTDKEQHCLSGSLSENQVLGGKGSDRVPVNRSTFLKIKKNRGKIMVSNAEVVLGLKASHETHCDNEAGSTLAGATNARSAKKYRQTQKDKNMEPTASELAAGGEFMSFSKSLDAGFEEFPDRSRSHCCSTFFSKASRDGSDVARCAQDHVLGGDQDIFNAAEISIIDQDIHMVTEMGSNDGQGYYFMEVDPIPIPGPPGSFLPSPGRMSSEDGNSSLTSSRIKSSVDHPEFVDRDSSGSPISATSTVSNSTVPRTGSRYSEKLSLGCRDSSVTLGCLTVQEENRSSFCGSNIDLVVENSTPALQTENIGEEKVGLGELNVNMIFPGKGPFRFKNNQPCCCVRKENASQEFALNRPESQLLRRRAMASCPLPSNEKQLSGDSNRRPDDIGLKSNIFFLSNSSSGLESHATKLSARCTLLGLSADSEFKLPPRDCESASPSASTPVIRLMGKNLMVVMKDECIYPQQESSQSNAMNSLADTKLPSVFCAGRHHEDSLSVHHVDAQSPLMSHMAPSSDLVQHVDVRSSNCFKSHDSSTRPRAPSAISPVSFSSISIGSGWRGSFDRHEHLGGCNSHTVENGQNGRRCSQMRYDMKKLITSPAEDAVKEIIVIDDSPDTYANSAIDAAHSMGMMGSNKSSVDIEISGYNARLVNFCAGQPHVKNASLPAQPAKVVHEIPAKWNYAPEGSSVVRPSSASSSSTGDFRSSLYYSPGFS